MRLTIAVVLAALGFASALSVENISGMVVNGTLRKPAAGDQVLLLKLEQGLQEIDHTITDASGRYSFTFPASGPHVIRVIHQGLVYDRQPHPGARSVDLEVFDTSNHVAQVSTSLIIVGLQVEDGALQVIEMHVVDNFSNPPRVASEGGGLEMHLPQGAQVAWARGLTAGGLPQDITPVRRSRSDAYSLNFPLRPGQTRLQIGYRLKYDGHSIFALQYPTPIPRLAVVVPEPLQFAVVNGPQFQRVKENGASVEVATGLNSGQTIAFRIDGKAPPAPVNNSALARSREQRSSAGIGYNSPDNSGAAKPTQPSHHHKEALVAAIILTAITLLVAFLGRTQIFARSKAQPFSTTVQDPNNLARDLEMLKDRIFRLELARQQGTLSTEQYIESKAVLALRLERLLAVEGRATK